MSRVAHWLDSRLRLAKFTRKAIDHVFPDHWSFMLGEIAMYSFILLVLTGIYMAMFFNASAAEVIYHGPYKELDGVKMTAAYQSVLHLSFEVPAGLLIRQMHHWAALIFVAAIVMHLGRLYFTAAYRKPREINWIVGVTLLLLVIFNGYLGYSVPGDLLSGTGLRIAYALCLSIPFLGPWLTYTVFGGIVPSYPTIPRMYALHIFALPALIAALIGVHIAIIWRQKHTNYPGPKRTDKTIVGSRLWPSYAAKSIGLFFLLSALVALLAGLIQINPVWIYGPDDPSAIIPGAQPDWYLGWIEGALRLFPGVNLHLGGVLVPEIFFPGILFPALLFLALYLFPFIEEYISADNKHHNVLRMPHQQPFNTAFGACVFMFLLVLFFAGSDDVIAVAADGSVVTIRTILRVLVFVAPAVTFVVVYGLCVFLRKQESKSHSP